jgi:acyl-coenzyme A synthetase/AMP-(fatty) acid ligase
MTPKTDKRFNVMESAENSWDVFQHVEERQEVEIPFVGLMPSPAKRVSSSSCRRDRIPLKFADAVDLKPFRRNKKSVQTIPNSTADDEVVLTSGTTGNKKLVPHLMGNMLTAATIA